jgi:hypothetical protein
MRRGNRCRLTFVQRDVLDLLRVQPEISYDRMAEHAGIDRHTAMQAVERLSNLYHIVKVEGRGRQPNRYLITDKVISCEPGYQPKPVLLTEEKRRQMLEQWECKANNPT